MNFTPIAARSARWLSFALAITLALQFVSPLVLAAEPQYTPFFAAKDSHPAGMMDDERLEENELQEDDALLADDDFLPFEDDLDSMPTLDSFPLRAPVPVLNPVDWRTNVSLTVKLNDDQPLYPTNAPNPDIPPYIELGASTNKLNIAVKFRMQNPGSDPRPDLTKEYMIKLSDKLTDFDFTPSNFPPELPVLCCRPTLVGEPDHPAIIFTMDPAAANRSDLETDFNLKFALKPYEGGDPADPEKIPIIDTDLTGPVYIYPVGAAGDPKIEKQDGDVSGIATAPHPVHWTVKFRTGRKAPINTPNYNERSIILVDTVKSVEQTFEEGTIDLKLTNNSGVSPVTSSLVKADDSTNPTNKPCYTISADKQTLTVYLNDMTDNKNPETLHLLTYTTNVNSDYFSKNQDKTINNAASLTMEGKPIVKDGGSAKLPKWIFKGNGEKGIDRDRVSPTEMPIAWKIRVNPNKTAGITIPTGAKLTDKLPKGLKKVVSVRSATKKPDGSYENEIDMYVPGQTNSDNAWTLKDGATDHISSGELNSSSDPSGTLTYTYPRELPLDGTEQVFIITALVDLQGVGADQSVAQTFTNEAFLQLGTTAPGFSSGESIVDVGVGYTLLHKEGGLDNLRDRTITWTTQVNNLNQTISNPVAIDHPGKGQLYVPGSFKVLDSNGAYTAGTFQLYKKDQTIVSDNTKSDAGIVAGDEFYWRYDFNAATITGPYTITYQTYALRDDYPTGTAEKNRTNKVTLYEEKSGNVLHELVTDTASVMRVL